MKTNKSETLELVQTQGFTLTDIPKIILVLGLGGIILGVTLYVMDETAGTFGSTTSAAYNGTQSAIQGVSKIGDFFTIIGISAAIAIVIGVLYFAFARFM